MQPEALIYAKEVVVRVVSRNTHLTGLPVTLTEDAVQHQDLAGEIDGSGHRRTFSVVLLCRCSGVEIDSVIAIQTVLASATGH